MSPTLPIQETFDTEDVHNTALCAWKEARGEGPDGMLAVICVLKNRVGMTGFAKNIHDVIYGKNQFTSMSVPSDPEFNLEPNPDDPDFGKALELAQRILIPGDEIVEDITKGALYYANLHHIDNNGWFYRNIVANNSIHRITAQIGKHTFFS